MSIVTLDDVPGAFGRCAVSIGVFDGVHLGHQALLAVLRAEAARLGVRDVVLTFDRHPRALLAPEREPRYLTTLDQKVDLLQSTGVQNVVVAKFDHALADLTAEEFVDRVLIDRLHCAVVVVGSNFKFGKHRSGDIKALRQIGDARGLRVIGVEPTVFQGAPVSSTRVRHTIERGEVDTAALLLGRPFTMFGEVVTGLGLGRQLGYPTANVDVADRQIVPPDGVYAVEAIVDGRCYAAACSIGHRPTIDGTEHAIEVLIDDFLGDIYGTRLGVVFRRKLRDQQKFESLASLIAQIGVDIAEARRIVAER